MKKLRFLCMLSVLFVVLGGSIKAGQIPIGNETICSDGQIPIGNLTCSKSNQGPVDNADTSVLAFVFDLLRSLPF